jgi:hypothetical protein
VKKGEKNPFSSVIQNNKYEYSEVIVVISTFDHKIVGDVYQLINGDRISIESSNDGHYVYIHQILNDMLNGDNAYELLDRQTFIKPNSVNLFLNHLFLRREKRGFD